MDIIRYHNLIDEILKEDVDHLLFYIFISVCNGEELRFCKDFVGIFETAAVFVDDFSTYKAQLGQIF